MLLEKKVDIGLVPIAVIPNMKEYHIISDYCIGCDGEVASVCLFSNVPLHKIERILLDYQSRTSVELLKILINQFWKIDPILEETSREYQSEISGTTAALVIGDRALEQRKISPYIYDLGFEWKKFTGLPFVFAAWISNKELSTTFVDSFNEANAFGLNNLGKVINDHANEIFNLNEYYTKFIKFEMNRKKTEALQRFLQYMAFPFSNH